MKVYYYSVSADCEGRTSRDVGYFLHHKDAQALADMGWGSVAMGSEKCVVKEREVYESLDDLAKTFTRESDIRRINHLLSDPQKIFRDRALAKLSPEEREALGV